MGDTGWNRFDNEEFYPKRFSRSEPDPRPQSGTQRDHKRHADEQYAAGDQTHNYPATHERRNQPAVSARHAARRTGFDLGSETAADNARSGRIPCLCYRH